MAANDPKRPVLTELFLKSQDWKGFVEILGTVAIVGSLIFVGFEIKQSREIAIADVYQQQAALLISIQTAPVPERVMVARLKLRAGEELSEDEIGFLKFHNNPWMTYFENIHFQYEAGMISEEHWESVKNEIGRSTVNSPYFLEYWEEVRGSWRRTFTEEVDQIIRDRAVKQR